MEGGEPFDMVEGLPPNYDGRIYKGATCYHMVIFEMRGSVKKHLGVIVFQIFFGSNCFSCLTHYSFRHPVLLLCESTERSFELNTVVNGSAEYYFMNDLGRIAKAGTLNVLGFNGFTNRVNFKPGDTVTADFHYSESLFSSILDKNPELKKLLGDIGYGERFELFSNNVYGEFGFFIELARSIDFLGNSIDTVTLENIASSLLLNLIGLNNAPPIELINWNCFYFAANLPGMIKKAKFNMKNLELLAENENLNWVIVRKLSKKLYARTPQNLIAELKFEEFLLMREKNYTKAELDMHFDETRANGLKNFVMRHMDISSSEFDKRFSFK